MVLTPLRDVPDLAFLVELQPVDRLLRISREENPQRTADHARLVRGLAHEIKNPARRHPRRGAAPGARAAGRALQEYTNIIIQEADRLRHLSTACSAPIAPQLARAQRPPHPGTRAQLLAAELPDAPGDRSRLRPQPARTVEAIGPADSGPAQHRATPCRRSAERAAPTREITLRTRVLRQFTIGEHAPPPGLRIDVDRQRPRRSRGTERDALLPDGLGRPEGTGLGLSIAQSIVNRTAG
jgi:two-component system nitrogen regulation sensor histidine kinase GlnL